MNPDLFLNKLSVSPRGQAMPKAVRAIGPEAFGRNECTEIRWIGNAGVMINSHGTCLLADPVFADPDRRMLFDCPISPDVIQKLDGILITHIDNDHFSPETCRKISKISDRFHAPGMTADYLRSCQLPCVTHQIRDTFRVDSLRISLTPVDHNWRSEDDQFHARKWESTDYCGYMINTPEGIVWIPGDSRLLEEHLTISPDPDVLLLDFSDDSWHITLRGALRIAERYPDAQIICIHWGTFDEPGNPAFNADPMALIRQASHPERIHVLEPGEAFRMRKTPEPVQTY